MKIRVYEAANICNIFSAVSHEQLGKIADKVTTIFIALLPHTREYNDALAVVQRDAKGKTQQQVEKLVSAKAFEKIANKVVTVDIPTLTMEEVMVIGKSVPDFKLANYNLLYPIIKN